MWIRRWLAKRFLFVNALSHSVHLKSLWVEWRDIICCLSPVVLEYALPHNSQMNVFTFWGLCISARKEMKIINNFSRLGCKVLLVSNIYRLLKLFHLHFISAKKEWRKRNLSKDKGLILSFTYLITMKKKTAFVPAYLTTTFDYLLYGYEKLLIKIYVLHLCFIYWN